MLFEQRHKEDNTQNEKKILDVMGISSVDKLLDLALPESIREGEQSMPLPPALSEVEALKTIERLAKKNVVRKSLIGCGFYGTIMPEVIKRNVFENPGWYTAYTAYQSEIAQGRLEALFNFQTLTSELTGLPIASASLLDEGTAIAEGVSMAYRHAKQKKNKVLVIEGLHPQNISVLETRMEAQGVDIDFSLRTAVSNVDMELYFAVVLQLPTTRGMVYDIKPIVEQAHEAGSLVIVAIDPMFLVLAGSPAEWGIDIAVGSFQRFGIPLGYGGPSAAFLATTEALKRQLPGRIVGETVDTKGRKAYRFALQTREQHIRREKATSNICTSQVLLAVLSSFYAVYHGYDGLKEIALRIFSFAYRFYRQIENSSLEIVEAPALFDTVSLNAGDKTQLYYNKFLDAGYNVRRIGNELLSVTFDETITEDDFLDISRILNLSIEKQLNVEEAEQVFQNHVFPNYIRKKPILTQETFHLYRTETEMMRYCRKLMDKDLALDRSMIPLGSCTMKLNPASAMVPLSWKEFSDIHPFVPIEQAEGYHKIIEQLEHYLCTITGYDRISLQPNAGSQGEFSGLLAIRAYLKSIQEEHRNICLIPSSAHGTNPASAQMLGLDVVVVACDKDGNIDFNDLQEKVQVHASNLAVLMITYPSTHGVYEDKIKDICKLIHEYGGQVYIDGANLNALVGVAKIAMLGADVSHINLHKTFSIPHGGGGPGVGPIGVKSHLAPFLPGNIIKTHYDAIQAQKYAIGQVSSSPWGSTLVCIISWMYIRMLGEKGLVASTKKAVLNANYIATRLASHYSILYTGKNNKVAHECIIDMRMYKEYGIQVEDIAKRLIDYGFHAPTMSFPVVGTLMVEPTESESLYELDRFCDAMILIKQEIEKVMSGVWPKEDNPLVNAPHCAQDMVDDEWTHPYTRKEAAYPFYTDAESNDVYKYWSPVSRVDNAYGDKNLICTCAPPDVYQ